VKQWRSLLDRNEFRWLVLAFFAALIFGLLLSGQISSGRGIFLCSMFVCLAAVAILLPRAPVDLENVFGCPVPPLQVVNDRVSGLDMASGQLSHVQRAEIDDIVITQVPFSRKGQSQVSLRINTIEILAKDGRAIFLVPSTDQDLTELIVRLRDWAIVAT
jgi:hypothetical protein